MRNSGFSGILAFFFARFTWLGLLSGPRLLLTGVLLAPRELAVYALITQHTDGMCDNEDSQHWPHQMMTVFG